MENGELHSTNEKHARLSQIKEQLGYLMPRYNRCADVLKNLDHEIMQLMNEKWAIEKKLTPVLKCKQAKVDTTSKLQFSKQQIRDLLDALNE